MKIALLLPGKIRPAALAAGQEEYIRRLRGFGVEVEEYKDEKGGSRPDEEIQAAEAVRILKRIKESDYLIACDERGQPIRTEMLAETVREIRQGSGSYQGRRRVVILIGGALGLSPMIRERADALWALSGMVLAGGIARLVLLEGLYRAITVVEGHPYHNG